jgi:nucleotide-binding universal stress UspA family protein
VEGTAVGVEHRLYAGEPCRLAVGHVTEDVRGDRRAPALGAAEWSARHGPEVLGELGGVTPLDRPVAGVVWTGCDLVEQNLVVRALEEFDVWVVSLSETTDRDLADIENVLQVRLALSGDIHTMHREGDPGEIIPEVASEIGADEIILLHERGSALREEYISGVVVNTDRPIVLIPVTGLA